MEINKIYNQDCLIGMQNISDKSIDCIKENRNFIGFELNKEYYEKSLERINTEKAMLPLF